MQTISPITDTAVLPPPPPIEDAERVARSLAELDTTWHPRVETAVSIAREWQRRRQQQTAAGQSANASFIIVAAPVAGDHTRTGHGCGKTHIALAALWSYRLMDGDRPVSPLGKFYLANDLIQKLDGESNFHRLLCYRWDYQTRQNVPPPILVIDDVGSEKQLAFIPAGRQEDEIRARYFSIINHCYESGISVIITANRTLDQLRDHVGGRAWSRLLEMAPRGAMLDMTGVPDYRRRAGGR